MGAMNFLFTGAETRTATAPLSPPVTRTDTEKVRTGSVISETAYSLPRGQELPVTTISPFFSSAVSAQPSGQRMQTKFLIFYT